MKIYDVFHEVFGGCPPLGFMLRDQHPDKWIRIHSLPTGKRYAEGKDEIAELLERQLKAASFALSDRPCHLFFGVYEENLNSEGLAWPNKLGLEKIDSINIAEEDDDAYMVVLYAGSLAWNRDLLAELIRDVADGKTGPVCLFAFDGSLYAPYEGGADLFFKDPIRLEHARNELETLKSKRPDGL